MKEYLFIGGAGHSGTTMLDHIFSSHSSSIGSKGESRIADSLNLFEKKYLEIDEAQERYAYLCKAIYFGYQFKRTQYTQESKEPSPFYLENFDSTQLSGVFCKDVKTVIDNALVVFNKSLFVEKTPSNVFNISNILKLIPEAKILIIHRDVRDVVASLKKRYLTLINNPEVFSHNLKTKKLDKDFNLVVDSYMWSKAVNAAKKNSTNIKVIKYEDFVSTPEKVLIDICKWIGIEFESHMLNLKSRNSSDIQLKNQTGISNSSVGSYKKVFSKAELRIVQKYATAQIDYLGYKKEKIPFNAIPGSLFLEVKEYLKTAVRVFKRVLLMDPRYLKQFSKNFIKKLRT